MAIITKEHIAASFRVGNGVELPQPPNGIARMHADLTLLGDVLSAKPVEAGFAWTDKTTVRRPTRHSAWFLGGKNGAFVEDPKLLDATDGNKAAGRRGLELLLNFSAEQYEALHNLKCLADVGIRLGALAVGIPLEVFTQGHTRYRVAHYVGAEGGGIGVHVDGNLITALLTNGPGLTELRYDGSRHCTDHRATSLMPGSTLYRASAAAGQPFLPTFHYVDMPPGTNKTSFVAAYNLPEGSYDLYGHPFNYDVASMKAGDNPHDGPLVPLWQQAANAHGVSVEDFSHSRFPAA